VARADGTAWCWGYNDSGEVGNGTADGGPGGSISTPTRVLDKVGGPLKNVAKVTAGGESTCALLKDGTLRCFGYNGAGQLGDGTTGDPVNHLRVHPVAVKLGNGLLGNVRSVSEGTSHTCAALNDGSAWCWGSDQYAQLGDGTTGDPSTHLRLSPVRVRTSSGFLADVVQISAGEYHTCAVTGDGAAWCWGQDTFGQVGDGTTGDPTSHIRALARRVVRPNQQLSGVSQISAASSHTCARRTDGSVWCWGTNANGELGDGTTGDPTLHSRLKAVRARSELGPLANIVNVGVGLQHSCARDTDGHAWCWGYDASGQLGDGTTGDPTTHSNLHAFLVERAANDLNGVRFATGGSLHSCALGPNGSVWCWGVNSDGELGRGTTDNNPHPLAAKVLFP
jgi:alpha-tubulin suppressor-like RCC1 family protein